MVLLCLSVGRIILVELRDGEAAQAGQESVTLTLVYAYQNVQWNQGIQMIAEEFQKEHPEIALDLQVQYENKVYEDILYKRQARGELGDIVQLKTPGHYAKEGLLAPIDQKIGVTVENPYQYQGEIYGMLALGTTNGILYNRDVFERYHLKEPESYDEFLQICQSLKGQGVTPVGVAGAELWHMEFWVNHFFRMDVYASDNDWLSKRQDGSVSWEEEAPVRMLAHLQQLFASGYLNEDWESINDGNLAYAMSQEKVAMIYTGSWTAREVQKLNPEISLGWFYLPDEEGNVVVALNDDVYWSVTEDCAAQEERYEAAMRFLEFFYDSDNYGRLCEGMCGYPVVADKYAFGEDGIQLEIKNKFEANTTHTGQYIGDEDTPQGFEKNMLIKIQELARQEITAPEAAACLEELWEYHQEQEN